MEKQISIIIRNVANGRDNGFLYACCHLEFVVSTCWWIAITYIKTSNDRSINIPNKCQ